MISTKQAGSSRVVELHGTNSTVICMSCSHQQTRLSFQQVLRDSNPNFFEANIRDKTIRPDGDVEIPQVR